MTQSLLIANQFAAALTGNLPNGVTVDTDRVGAFDIAEMPYVLISLESEDSERHDAIHDISTLVINVEIGVRAQGWKAAADIYADAINPLLMNDAPLKMLTTRVRRLSKKWEAHEADMTAGTLTLGYQVIYLLAQNAI